MERHNRRLESQIKGAFWFSARQWGEQRDHKRHRMFCMIGGNIMEYTELIDDDRLMEEPNAVSEYPDAKCLGYGSFDHFEDM